MKTPSKKGSVFGGMLLIAGSCVGSGMLGLPIITGLAGFFPALIMFFIAWAFMTTTALYLVEVNSWFKERVNFITMVQKTLGKTGRVICWITYLLLFYSLSVAYIALSGSHFSSLIDWMLGLSVPKVVASIFFVFVFGSLVTMGTRSVDLFNRALMFVKIGAFLVLIFVGASYVQLEKLEYVKMDYALFALPILIISFGFQNMIPSLNHYMGGDTKRVRQAIIGGSLFAFAIYILWEILALGILSPDGKLGILDAFKQNLDAAQALNNIMKSSIVGISAQFLALFAILTSFLAQTLALAHFLGDGLKAKNKDSFALVALALIPPLIFEMVYPNIFYQAMNFAGGFCAVILFGILPAAMLWKGRYSQKMKSPFPARGGRVAISFVGIFAFFMVVYQLSNMLGLYFFPHP